MVLTEVYFLIYVSEILQAKRTKNFQSIEEGDPPASGLERGGHKPPRRNMLRIPEGRQV
jgi:hypothetical protein